MKIAFYNGVSGMMSYQEAMNRISHNRLRGDKTVHPPEQRFHRFIKMNVRHLNTFLSLC